MSIQVKSIPQFTRAQDPRPDDVFLMSRYGGEDWDTYSVEFGEITAAAEDKISSDISARWNLGDVDVGGLANRVGKIEDSSMVIGGEKTFEVLPKVSDGESRREVAMLANQSLVTKLHVNSIIDNSQSFIGSTSKIDVAPNNNTPNTAEDADLLVWRMPEGGSDSTAYVGDFGTSQANGVTCNKTGQLVVYGWLADGGGVLPQEAWVALYGKIKTKNNNSEWVILQLQPWNVSQRSKVLQYVGFNIPVRSGLQLKIKTGFRVSRGGTATNSGNSLVFPNVQSNVFVGYIVQ